MADCLNPRFFRYRDAFSHELRTSRVRCGRCVNCIAAEQDAWSVRLSESCVRNEEFIYTTLTFSPAGIDKLEKLDISDALFTEGFEVWDASRKYLDYWFERLGFGNLPLFEKKVLSDWIKRGREQYYRDTGERLKFKYLFTMELGPLHGRPHAHGIIIGLKPKIYIDYFAKPWRDTYGYYNSQHIHRNPKFVRSCIAVSHYISKYINKGSFECPLVLNGLLPKCWRMVSNGIGEELLDSPRYKSLQDKFSDLSSACECVRWDFETLRHGPGRDKFRLEFYTSDKDVFLDGIRKDPLGSLGMSYEELSLFTRYTDDNSYNHCLPRYYRYKLLGRLPNVYRYAVQTAILQDVEQCYYSDLSSYASSLECSGACEVGNCPDYRGAVRAKSLYLAGHLLATQKRLQAERQAARNYTEIANHYKRPKQYDGVKNIVLLQ